MAERDEGRMDRMVREAYRATPPPDAAARQRLGRAIESARPPRRVGALGWWLDPVSVSVRPAAALAALLALAAAGTWALRASRPAAPPAAQSLAPALQAVGFVLAAPEARSVALVGDFNNWDRAATPMRRAGDGASWVVVVPLEPGRHLYGFVVDGSRWVNDPAAPLAADAAFGDRNSVVLVSDS
jgi:hypothetical protein